MKVKVSGVITLTSPLHISDPEKGWRFDVESGRVKRVQKGGFSCTATRTESFRCQQAVTETNPIGRVRLPIIPAQGIKGNLRRAAEKIVENSFIDRGMRMKAVLYQAMRTGAVTGRPDGSIPPLDVAKSRREHFFAGLFGGGTQMVPGWLYAKDGRLFADCYIENGAVPDGLSEQISSAYSYQLLEGRPIIRKDDFMQGVDPDAPSHIEDYDDYMITQIEEITKRRASKKSGDEDSDGSRSLQSISYVETVIGGTEFYFEVGANNINEAQAGMLIESLAAWLSSAKLGGKSGVGFGSFTHDLSVQVDDTLYQGVFGDETSPISANCPDEILTLTSAMYDALENTTPDDLMGYMVTGV